MKRIILWLCLFLVSGIASAQYRLLLVGDSITGGTGSSDGLGFRDELYNRLRISGLPFTFHGPVGDYPWQAHYFSGALIDEFYYGPGGLGGHDTGTSMDRFQPDFVFIHLGTNGIEGGGSFGTYTHDGGLTLRDDTLPGRLANLLAYLVKWKTGVRGACLKNIVISQLIDKPEYRAGVEAFNAEVARICRDSESGLIPAIPQGTLRLADHYTGFDAGTMFSPDSIHPNDAGYAHMADEYMRAVHLLPMRIAHHSPQFVSGLMNSSTPEVLTVRLTDDHGDPVYAADVRFEVLSGGAVISGGSTARTDTAGLASVEITASEPGLSVIRARSACLRDSLADFTVSAQRSVGIDGFVYYRDEDSPLAGVGIKWVEQNRIVDSTDTSGAFQYQLFPHESTVTLVPEKTADTGPNSGIIMYDAALAARSCVGVETLDSAAAAAADVDNDGIVTMADAALIARYAVGITGDSGSNAGTWEFSPASAYFPVLEDNVPGYEFFAVLKGDVDGDRDGRDQASAARLLAAGSVHAEAAGSGDTGIIRLSASHAALLSFDVKCLFDESALEFERAETGREHYTLFVNPAKAGSLRIGMFGPVPLNADGTVIISLVFTIIEGGTGGSVTLTGMRLNAERAADISVPLRREIEAKAEPGALQVRNYPNPFNGGTVIRYRIEESSHVQVRVYNNLGREVQKLADSMHSKGTYTVNWDGRDSRGEHAPSGIYFCLVTAASGKRAVRKMELLR